MRAGCSASDDEADLVAGKEQFVEKCGACHTLARAGTKGTQGPNLDEAFQQALASGMGRRRRRGRRARADPQPGDAREGQPGLHAARARHGQGRAGRRGVRGRVVAAGGEDTGLLAEAGKPEGGGEPAVEKNGVLEIEATAQLAYVTNKAEGEARRR